MQNRTLFLHIGAHKTASSLLQSALRIDNQKIKQKGLHVFHRSEMLNTPFYVALKRYLRGVQTDYLDTELATDAMIKQLKKGKHDLLMTNEDIFCELALSSFYQNVRRGIEFVRRCFPEFNLKVLLFIRKQPDYIESIYTQYIHMGKSVDFSDFIGNSVPKHLDWLKVVNNIASEVGEENVVVRPFEAIKLEGQDTFYQKFLSSLGVVETSGFMIDADKVNGRKSNRSFSKAAIEIFKAGIPYLNEEEKNNLRAFLQKNFSTATHEKAHFLSEQHRIELHAFYRESNSRLFQQFVGDYTAEELGYN